MRLISYPLLPKGVSASKTIITRDFPMQLRHRGVERRLVPAPLSGRYQKTSLIYQDNGGVERIRTSDTALYRITV